MLVPALMSMLSGKVGKLRPSDIFMILFGLWGSMALFVTADFDDAIQPAGIFFIESVGAYLIGRVYIRDQAAFLGVVKFIFLLLMALLPFALFESLTNRPIIQDALRPFFSVISKGNIDPRYGLYRAQVVFDHPILFGAFATSILGLVFYVLRHQRQRFLDFVRPVLVVLTSLLSLSSGAIAALLVQFILIAWDYGTRTIRKRWLILSLIVVAAYFVVDLMSNRSPFHVIVTYLTFSTGSSYNRILIWQYGSAEVWRHPLFGIGFGEWLRPAWMGASMDNFWLVIAVRHGIPAFLMLSAAFLFMIFGIGSKVFASESLRRYRAGLLVSLGSLIIAGATVDYWNAIYTWFLFLLGSGMWMFDATDQDGDAAGQAQAVQAPSSREAAMLRRAASRVRRPATPGNRPPR